MPGPLPHPQRRRRNKPDFPTTTMQGAGGDPTWPDPDPGWDPRVIAVYTSLPLSAQSTRYEPSDVATARVICEGLHRVLTAEKFNSAGFAACLNALDGLGATLGGRLRLRLDVQKPTEEPASVRALRKYRVMTGGDGDA
jgi:hypothetical protein